MDFQARVVLVLERDGKQAHVIVRQDDCPNKLCAKFRWGSGKCWKIIDAYFNEGSVAKPAWAAA